VIWGGRVSVAKIAVHASKRAVDAVREADRAEAHAWSLHVEGFGGPAQLSNVSKGKGSNPISRDCLMGVTT
jgi:hypothetical protein